MNFATLNTEQQRVYNLYKSNAPHLGKPCFHDFIADELRAGRALEEEWEVDAKIMDSIIKMGGAQEKIELFRATFEDFVAPFISLGIYRYPTFMSTSTDDFSIQKHWADAFGRIPALLKITCPPGTPMIDGELNVSHGGHEEEIIIGRCSTFRVISVTEITDLNQIYQLMGGYYSRGKKMLKVYELEFLKT
jgi:hypothetical protein